LTALSGLTFTWNALSRLVESADIAMTIDLEQRRHAGLSGGAPAVDQVNGSRLLTLASWRSAGRE
jgi:hypothetical protein